MNSTPSCDNANPSTIFINLECKKTQLGLIRIRSCLWAHKNRESRMGSSTLHIYFLVIKTKLENNHFPSKVHDPLLIH